jgi:thioredoxin reductase (NADPH)
MADKIITPDVAKALKEGFKKLEGDVSLHVFTKKGVNEQFNQIIVRLIKELAEFDSRIKPAFNDDPNDSAWIKFAIERSPTILISPEKYKIRYTGSPIGEESRTFILALIMASSGKSYMDKELLDRLKTLDKPRYVKVFVSPTCPYCPYEVLHAVSAAIEMPEMVSLEVIETYENLDLAERYGAMSVPKTYIDEKLVASYLEPQEELINNLLKGAGAAFAPRPEEARESDVLIIGGGPAGLTAAIYAGRSGLNTTVLEKANVGGQMTITPFVENYPGFSNVGGKTLVDMMFTQAAQYARIKQGVEVKDVRRTDDLFECATTGGLIKATAIIIATGAVFRKLNVPGEDRLAGRGISYCATCDGYIFKDGKAVAVIGGGNTAVTDALYLDGLGAHVTLIHRGETLKAEDKLKQALFQRNLPVLWDSRVVEFEGERKLEKVKLENTKDGSIKEIKLDGAFIAVGYEPSNELAWMIGLALDKDGYVKVNERQETSEPFIYAAGDITGGEKQITVAVSQGTVAAISAFQDLTKAGLIRK